MHYTHQKKVHAVTLSILLFLVHRLKRKKSKQNQPRRWQPPPMHSCGTTLDPRWACRSQCPKVIYPPVKLIWLAGNSPFPIGNTSSNGGLFHCYVSLPEGNVHLTPCRAVVLLFVGLSRGMGRAHQHVPFFVVCFSYVLEHGISPESISCPIPIVLGEKGPMFIFFGLPPHPPGWIG